jgi:hypothetical protein
LSWLYMLMTADHYRKSSTTYIRVALLDCAELLNAATHFCSAKICA